MNVNCAEVELIAIKGDTRAFSPRLAESVTNAELGVDDELADVVVQFVLVSEVLPAY